MIVTIDGPAGSGKSAVAAALADKIGAAYLDTGAMYRAVTLAALQGGVSLDDTEALVELVAAGGATIEFSRCNGKNRLLLNNAEILADGSKISQAIRRPQVTATAFKIASVPKIRQMLIEQQRQIAQHAINDPDCQHSIVTEGRDQGTVVFPEARFKFYLNATDQCRSRRRFQQLQRQGRDDPGLGTPPSYQEILGGIQMRDRRDATRDIAPLKPANDAVVVDTTELTLEQVVELLYKQITDSDDFTEGYNTK